MQTYKNNHTTSTKCQYQEAASKAKCLELVKCKKYNFPRQVNKKIVPIITCKPWNPVAIKNIEPYTESAIQKGASIYSSNWRLVKISPKIIVIIKVIIASIFLPFTILWWDQVTVAPELNNTTVFKSGIEKGFKGWIPNGGQLIPISILGAKLLWKKVQKKEKKNKTSDTINKINPIFKPFKTDLVW